MLLRDVITHSPSRMRGTAEKHAGPHGQALGQAGGRSRSEEETRHSLPWTRQV